MSRHADSIRLLLAQGPTTARQLVEKTGISQPTISRALATLGDDAVRIGSGPAIRYALRDTARGFAAAPVFSVSEAGQIREIGTLIPVRPDGFVMVQADGTAQHSDGLPWWLFDMRPQGFLGRAYASTYAAALGLPANPEHWRDADVIRALLTHGHDAVGNLLIGPQARDRFIEQSAPQPVDRSTAYPALAAAASAGEAPGSSAGGEQPKFCAYTDRGHVLVKFTAPDDNPVTERWRDLLLAEHLALSVLGVDSDIVDIADQRFLEIPRFDRIGQLGRIGVASLRALDAEFIGDATAPWPALVSRLAAAGHVHPVAIASAALRWAFGTLIGNTDMHAGNLSFVGSTRPYPLAPAYDTLPMAFAPRSGGAIVNTLPPAVLTASVDGETWRAALQLAETYFARVSEDESFSGNFAPCIAALRGHIDDAASRISRLG